MTGTVHNWFWVNENGGQLALRGIEGALRRGPLARFGRVLGAHCFRHALETANMIANPTTPAVVAAVLGNSPAVVEQHYILSGQIEAAQRLHNSLEVARAQGSLPSRSPIALSRRRNWRRNGGRSEECARRPGPAAGRLPDPLRRLANAAGLGVR